jgi:hypothetical protein
MDAPKVVADRLGCSAHLETNLLPFLAEHLDQLCHAGYFFFGELPLHLPDVTHVPVQFQS